MDKTIRDGAAADALEIDNEGFGAIACTDAVQAGIRAFGEKRKPEFKKQKRRNRWIFSEI